MKTICLFFSMFIFSNVNAQIVKQMSRYYKRITKDERVHFSIRNNDYSFDSVNNFYNRDSIIYKGSKDSLETFEIINSRFLLISFYPASDIMLAFGADARVKSNILIIDMENPKRKWWHNLRGLYYSTNIRGFDDKKGELLLVHYLKKP